MKKKLLNSMRALLVAAGLCAGATSAWAGETTTLYERGVSTDWSSADISTTGNYVWGGNAEITTKGYPYVSGNGGRISSMTLVPSNNVILTVDAVWNTGGDGNNATNYTYFRIGNNLEFQAHTTSQVGNVVINGTSYVITNACKKDVNRTDDEWTIHAVINTASMEVTTLTLTGKNGGTKNATYTLAAPASLGESATFNTMTFGTHREKYSPYCGLISLSVMQETQDIATANYTINYKEGGVTVKTVSGTDVAVGTTISVLSSFYEGGKKYITDDGQVSSLTVAAGGSTLDVNVTEAPKYTCTVNLKAGDVLLASINEDVYSGESTTIYYHKAYEKDGKWYFSNANGSAPGYGVTFSDVVEAQNADITTFGLSNDVIYFADAEDLTIGGGSWAANGAYLNWRSNGMAKRLAANSYIYTSTIAAGVYDVTLWARNQRSAGDGTEGIALYLRDGEGNLTDLGVSFPGWARGGYEDAKTATITIPDDGKSYSIVINNNTQYTSNLELDYMFVKNTAVSATIPSSGFGTIASGYALDCSKLPQGVKAYKVTAVTSEAVTLAEVTEAVAAGTGLILNGAAGDYSIPVAATGATLSDNKLHGAVEATLLADGSFYILQNGKFCKVSGATTEADRTMPAGKAYLLATDVPANARSLNFEFGDEATGISAVAREVNDGEYYNLQGQRVSAPKKGLYIVNGKKVVVK